MASKQIKVTELRAGMTLDIGKKGVKVRNITGCKHKRRGVPKIHVNDRFCYDTAGYVDIKVPAEPDGAPINPEMLGAEV